jgi:hypothetical protein
LAIAAVASPTWRPAPDPVRLVVLGNQRASLRVDDVDSPGFRELAYAD